MRGLGLSGAVTAFLSNSTSIMAGLLDVLGPALSGTTLQQLSGTIGADEQTTKRAALAALPLLLGAMNRNTDDPEGARSLATALEQDHDGGLLDHLGGFLGAFSGGTGAAAAFGVPGVDGRATNGAGILRHVFGDRLSTVEQGVGKATGLDRGQVMQMLVALAPIVMAYLGRQKRQQNLDGGGLSDLLRREAGQAREAAPNDLLGSLGAFLDRDGDGNPLDDVTGMLGGFLGKR
jgi:hypothetical protein